WVPLALAWRGLGPRAASAVGAVTGLVAHVMGFAWLPSALADFTATSMTNAAVVALLVVVFQGASVGVFAALATWFAARWSLPIGMAIALPLMERFYPWLAPVPVAT